MTVVTIVSVKVALPTPVTVFVKVLLAVPKTVSLITVENVTGIVSMNVLVTVSLNVLRVEPEISVVVNAKSVAVIWVVKKKVPSVVVIPPGWVATTFERMVENALVTTSVPVTMTVSEIVLRNEPEIVLVIVSVNVLTTTVSTSLIATTELEVMSVSVIKLEMLEENEVLTVSVTV